MARSRISTFESEPLDPAASLRHWDTVDLPDSNEYSAGPYYDVPDSTPYQSDYRQQVSGDGSSRVGHGEPFYSPEISPPLRSQAWGRPELRLSVVSPQSPDFSRTATSGPLGYSPLDFSGGPRLSTLAPDPLSVGLSANRGSVAYSIPPAPAPPSIPTDIDDSDYQRVKIESHNAIESEGNRGGLGANLGGDLGRGKSMARRVSTRIMSAVRGRPRTWGGPGETMAIDEESLPEGTKPGGYMKVEENEEAVGFDLDFFTAEHVPAAAVQAMQVHKMDKGLIYTDTGEAIDLSSFSGLDADKDSDTFSLHRAGNTINMHAADQKSYYFVPNRDIPNWKPFSMRTWFIVFLLLLSLLMLCAAEVLFQLSNRGMLRKDGKQGILKFKTVDDLDLVQFAMWKYMPTVVAVIYGILWKITDTEVKRAEPYYQLSRGTGGGALAASTLNIEYQTFWSLLVPVEAIRHKQWVVVASSVASLVAFAIVPVLLSVFVEITPSQKAREKMGLKMGLKDYDIEKTITVASEFTRILEGTLFVILVFGMYMLIELKRRRSGLLGDPSGIAGVAAMANKCHILMDFQGLDMASEEKIHKQLNKRTYILHKGSLWQAHFLKESERDNQAPKAMNAHPLLLRLKGGIPFLIFLAVFAGILWPMARGSSLTVVIDKTPWVLTMVSVTIKSLWEIVEKDMRMLEPFWVLYKRHAPSSVLTLDYSATIPGWLPFKALYKGHFLLAWVGFASVLVEILTVVLGSLDYNGGEESDTSYNVSFALAMGILVVLILTMCLVLYLRRQTFLPRQPGTISSVLAFIHQSNMLVDFEGTEQASTAQRRDKLAKIGKTYGFGWFKGRDGNRHLGIDFEELLGSYTFGDESHEKGTMRGGDVGTWETFERPMR